MGTGNCPTKDTVKGKDTYEQVKDTVRAGTVKSKVKGKVKVKGKGTSKGTVDRLASSKVPLNVKSLARSKIKALTVANLWISFSTTGFLAHPSQKRFVLITGY